jgi:hypothetical protein
MPFVQTCEAQSPLAVHAVPVGLATLPLHNLSYQTSELNGFEMIFMS